LARFGGHDPQNTPNRDLPALRRWETTVWHVLVSFVDKRVPKSR